MRPDTRLHANQARRQVRKPLPHLATGKLLAKHNSSLGIQADEVKRVLTDTMPIVVTWSIALLVMVQAPLKVHQAKIVQVKSTVGPSHWQMSFLPRKTSLHFLAPRVEIGSLQAPLNSELALS